MLGKIAKWAYAAVAFAVLSLAMVQKAQADSCSCQGGCDPAGNCKTHCSITCTAKCSCTCGSSSCKCSCVS